MVKNRTELITQAGNVNAIVFMFPAFFYGQGMTSLASEYELIMELTDVTAKRIASDREEWTNYLKTAARLYRFPFRGADVYLLTKTGRKSGCFDGDMEQPHELLGKPRGKGHCPDC